MSKRARRAYGLSVLLVLLVAPLALWWWRTDLSESKALGVVISVTGLTGLVGMVLATGVASRLKSLTASLGIDRIMSNHKWLGIAALALVIAHTVVAVVRSPKLLDPFAASTGVQLGYGATLGMVLLSAAAAWGRRPGARYEWWARAHVVMAGAALVLAGLHVYWLGDMLEDPVLRVMCSALAVALLAVLSRRWVWQPLFSDRGSYVVYGARDEGPDVVTLALAPVSLRKHLRFEPGQFVWLRRRRRLVGTEEHPFTIASSAETSGRLEVTVRADGDFTRELVRLAPGSKVWLDGPHGSFTPEPPARVDGLVLVAGGVGVTPMMSMLRTLAQRGDRRRHQLVLAERPDQPLFGPELDFLTRRLHLDVVRTQGRRVDVEFLRETLPRTRDRLEYYVCGPPSLLEGTLAALDGLRVPRTRINTEQFGWTGSIPVDVGGGRSSATHTSASGLDARIPEQQLRGGADRPVARPGR